MYPLRDNLHHPVRSKVKVKATYQQYKNELRRDFHEHCGYCSGWDRISGGVRVFQIDHFIPRKPKGFSHSIPDNDYDNLVYSCFYCNNSKRNDFPTNNHELPNDGKIGYIDPCSKEYCSNFYRNQLGEIVPNSQLGWYIYKRLKFYLKRHAILWRVEQVHTLILELKNLGGEDPDKISGGLYTKLLKLHFTYFHDLINNE